MASLSLSLSTPTTPTSLSFTSSSIFFSSHQFHTHNNSFKSNNFPILPSKNPLSISCKASPPLPVLNFSGEKVGESFLDLRFTPPDTARVVVHHAVVTDLQNKRRGTASTLTRGEVRGGGRKPFLQKKTSRAYRPCGGVIFGPKPHDWCIKINCKEKRLAISTAVANVVASAVVCTNLYLGEAYDTTNLPFHDGRHHPHPPLRAKGVWKEQQNKSTSLRDITYQMWISADYSSQPFDATEDHLHLNISTPTLESSSSTRPNEPNFTTKPNLPNGELSPFSEDEDEVLHNQPQEKDDEEEAQSVSPITIVPPYYISPLMQNFEESYFQDFEYEHSLDCKEVQHPVGTLFKRMCFLKKQDKRSTCPLPSHMLACACKLVLVNLLVSPTLIEHTSQPLQTKGFPDLEEVEERAGDEGGFRRRRGRRGEVGMTSF
ncbi:hypothetical protein JHK86_009591 [Glycine max]|nr:hypothetical protein JHK86_009591 [Glycine max]